MILNKIWPDFYQSWDVTEYKSGTENKVFILKPMINYCIKKKRQFRSELGKPIRL